MRAPWKQVVLDRLTSCASARGGFGYRPSVSPNPEATSLACLALLFHDRERSLVERSLGLLGDFQTGNGAVAVCSETPAATWPTAMAVVAWLAWAKRGSNAYDTNINRALEYLLANEGKTFSSDPRIYGHDTQLVGWPWIEDTHTWVEPTCYALLALRAAGVVHHSRIDEAERAIYNRAIPSGGWNYGNGRMFVNELRSFPSTSGMVLAALRGRKRDETIAAAIDYLHGELPEVRSPFSLAWGMIGLRCWDALPADAAMWIARTATAERPAPPSPLADALMLIAIADEVPFGSAPPGGEIGSLVHAETAHV